MSDYPIISADSHITEHPNTYIDEFWEAAIELELPLSFHILTTRGERTRGLRMNSFLDRSTLTTT